MSQEKSDLEIDRHDCSPESLSEQESIWRIHPRQAKRLRRAMEADLHLIVETKSWQTRTTGACDPSKKTVTDRPGRDNGSRARCQSVRGEKP